MHTLNYHLLQVWNLQPVQHLLHDSPKPHQLKYLHEIVEPEMVNFDFLDIFLNAPTINVNFLNGTNYRIVLWPQELPH